jgi:hypothetical protein
MSMGYVVFSRRLRTCGRFDDRDLFLHQIVQFVHQRVDFCVWPFDLAGQVVAAGLFVSRKRRGIPPDAVG